MQPFSTSPLGMAASLWRHRHLVLTLTTRDVIGRYRGSVLGLLWSFFHPLLMLGVYTFVFGIVFGARWNPASDSKFEFAVVLFAGLLVYNLFAECVSRAPGLVVSNANYVKKVVFPLEVLPAVAMGSALFHGLVGLGVWYLFHLAVLGPPPVSAWLLPVVVLPLVLFTMGVSWALASLGVFLRDVSQITSIIVTILLFLSPVFFPISALPPGFRPLFLLNPLTPSIEMVRGVLMWGRLPDWELLAASFAVGAAAAWGGYAWFQKTRQGFADVL